MYIIMHTMYDTPCLICDSNFFPASHLCLVVYMCPTLICDTQNPICGSKITVYFVENWMAVDKKLCDANWPSDVVNHIHIYDIICRPT